MKYNKIISSIIIVIVLSGCGNFEEYNTNPHRTSEVSSSLLATRLILNVARQNTGYSKTYLAHCTYSKLLLWTEGQSREGQYNEWQRTDVFENQNMTNLVNADKMIEAAPDEGLKNAYMGVRNFIRVYKFLDLTLRVGDIPYSEAMKGESENNFFPKYDTQKEVFLGLLDELDEADRLLQNATNNFAGDPVYKGNVAKWRKLVNSYQLNVLIHLHLKADDPDVRLKQRFQELLSRPLFESNADNFQLLYSDKTNQRYPYYKDGNNYMAYSMMSSVLVDSLKAFKDYRLFYYANPMTAAINADGLSESDFEAYAGVDPTIDFETVMELYRASVSNRRYSMMASRYSEYAPGEPIYIFSYADVKFILAEACVKGFITGNAQQYYEEGVRAAMTFTGSNTPDAYTRGRKITPEYIAQYLTNPGVKFESTPQRQLEQIGTQRYISMFLQAPWEGVWQLRRINIPNIPVNPATNLNTGDKTKLPVRWMYPNREYINNTEKVNEAVQRQFGGNDSADGVMWILKK